MASKLPINPQTPVGVRHAKRAAPVRSGFHPCDVIQPKRQKAQAPEQPQPLGNPMEGIQDEAAVNQEVAAPQAAAAGAVPAHPHWSTWSEAEYLQWILAVEDPLEERNRRLSSVGIFQTKLPLAFIAIEFSKCP